MFMHSAIVSARPAPICLNATAMLVGERDSSVARVRAAKSSPCAAALRLWTIALSDGREK